MSTDGIKGIMIETESWADSAAFWTQLGFEVEYETEEASGMLRHPSGGPYIFLVERGKGEPLEVQPVLGVADHEGFEPPAAGTVAIEFKARPWGAMEMLVRDPDGRRMSIQAPDPGADSPSG